MTTVQLRRYQLEPGRTADFLAWFPAIVPVREQYGFRVSSALVDTEHHTFTWTVEHDGDQAAFAAAEQVYNASPERATAFETFPRCVAVMELGFVTDVLAG